MLKTKIQVGHNERIISENLYAEQIYAGARFQESAHWPYEEKRYKGPGTPIYRERWPGSESLLLDLGNGAFASVSLSGQEVTVYVAAGTAAAAEAAMSLMREAMPKTPLVNNKRPVVFWSDHAQGPRSVTRVIDVPNWAKIAANYPLDVALELERAVEFQPSAAGQLLLWRGKPGTGKTWALRALIKEWEWAYFHYITDPDALFGTNASYLLQVLLDNSEFDVRDKEPPWKVLVLEDAGEMLSRDARERSGQGLSRLLNLVDGLIGQGLRVLVLVTTNEELGSLHPAISRPGRCAVNMEFRELSQEEAQSWLQERGGTMAVKSHTSIADLYAMLQGIPVPAPEVLGFTHARN